MKTIALILHLIIFSCGNLLAQGSKKFNYQIDLGNTLTIPYKKTFEFWPEIENHPKTTFSAGLGYFTEIMISYNLQNKYAITTGLNYNFRSFKMMDRIGLLKSNSNITSNSLTVPLLIKYRFSPKIPISLGVGPYLSYLIQANEKGTLQIDTSGFKLVQPQTDPAIDLIEPSQNFDSNIRESFKLFDYGLSFQLDYDFKLNNTFTGVLLTRFNYGMKNTIKNDDTQSFMSTKWKNYSLLIGFGLKL